MASHFGKRTSVEEEVDLETDGVGMVGDEIVGETHLMNEILSAREAVAGDHLVGGLEGEVVIGAGLAVAGVETAVSAEPKLDCFVI
jgi:hypothetical protein